MMEWLTQNWPHILAVAAIVISILAFRQSKRRTELAEKIESDRQRDARRADLRCMFEETPGVTAGYKQFEIILRNYGPAVASEIDIELDGRHIRELSDLVVDWVIPGELASGTKTKIGRLVPGQDRGSHSGKLRWKDDSGESREAPIFFKP